MQAEAACGCVWREEEWREEERRGALSCLVLCMRVCAARGARVTRHSSASRCAEQVDRRSHAPH
eukprot:1952706-Rhodomonas_salina.3